MSFSEKSLRLYAVTDRAWVGEGTLAAQVEQALAGGVTCVQLREKNLPPDAFLREAEEILPLCKKRGVPLIVNDAVDVALACGADGIHVGQSDASAADVRRRMKPGMILGVSAQTVEQALRAQDEGADYLGVGAMFYTGTKSEAVVVDYQTLKEICAAVSIPVVAIGGLNRDTAGTLAGSGICGIAVVSAIFAAPDIRAAASELLEISESLCRRRT